MPGLYVLGCWERNVSIYLQQVRALNLAARFDLPRQSRIAVVGGGFAGLTVAAWPAGAIEPTFWNRLRSCSWPSEAIGHAGSTHLHDWPWPGSEDPRAGLPLLDWTAGLAADVAAHVLEQFAPCGVEVTCGAATPPLTKLLEDFDAVILALGLGIEKSFADLPLNSYWMDDSVATEGTTFRHYFVSGIGEGGVIDTLYLRLRNFSQADVVSQCLSGLQPLKDRLLSLEGDPNLTARYAELDVPQSVDHHLRQRLRSDTMVTLNGGTMEYLSPKADILNRFLLSRLVHLGAVHYAPGRLTEVKAHGDGYHIRLDQGPLQPFDRVLIRHGTVPALKRQYPEVWRAWVGDRTVPEAAEVSPAWPPGFWD